jgi:hypothetical protein
VHWFEEALTPDSLEDFAKLREHSPVPISGGEVLTRRQAFQPFLEARAFDIIQPDVTKVGDVEVHLHFLYLEVVVTDAEQKDVVIVVVILIGTK